MESISGGFLHLIAAIVTIVTLPKLINDHRKEYNKWGQQLGETLYEYNHPYDPNQ